MADIILEMKNITKEFPGVKALDNVNLTVERGTIHALIGENGAGKSTLMNVLSGIYPYGTYSGEIYYNGKLCQFKTLKESEAENIVIIHQELALIPLLSIGENMFLGNEIKNSAGIIDWNKTYAEAEKHMKQVGLQESPHSLIKDIGTGKQQLVEIAKAFSKNVKLLILDEPTVGLDPKQIADIRILVKSLAADHTVIFSSHILSEVNAICDSVVIMYKGKVLTHAAPNDLVKKLDKHGGMLLCTKDENNQSEQILQQADFVKKYSVVEVSGNIKKYYIKFDDIDFSKKIFFAFADRQIPIIELTPDKFTLEDAFLQYLTAAEQEAV